MTLKAGVAEVIITPPVGIPLAGYAFGPSVGVLDDLRAQALVVTSDAEAVAIITADVIGFGPRLVADIRRQIEQRLGIRGSCVLLAASHTHSGPATEDLRQWGPTDAAYLADLTAQIVDLVDRAQRGLRDARLGYGMGRVEGQNENRRVPGGPVDASVPVLRVDTMGGQTLAVLYSYGCHPVTLHSYRNLIAPDFPGYARNVVRSGLGPDTVVLFTLGLAGDVNPAGYRHGETTVERVRQLGDAGDLTLASLPPPDELRAHRDQFDREAWAREATSSPLDQISVSQIKRDWAVDALAEWAAGRVRTSLRCELQAIRLGDVTILGLPLEVFVETGLAIRTASPADVTLFSTNSNGSIGYLPTAHAFAVERDYANPQGLAPKVYGIYAFAGGAEPQVRAAAGTLLAALYAPTG